MMLTSRAIRAYWIYKIHRYMVFVLQAWGLSKDFLAACDSLGVYIAGAPALAAASGEIRTDMPAELYVNSLEDKAALLLLLERYGYMLSGEERFDYRPLFRRTENTLANGTASVVITHLLTSSAPPQYIRRNTVSLHAMNWYFRDQLHVYSPYHIKRGLIGYNPFSRCVQGQEGTDLLVSKYRAQGFCFEKWEALRKTVAELCLALRSDNLSNHVSFVRLCQMVTERDKQWPVDEIYRTLLVELPGAEHWVRGVMVFRGLCENTAPVVGGHMPHTPPVCPLLAGSMVHIYTQALQRSTIAIHMQDPNSADRKGLGYE